MNIKPKPKPWFTEANFFRHASQLNSFSMLFPNPVRIGNALHVCLVILFKLLELALRARGP